MLENKHGAFICVFRNAAYIVFIYTSKVTYSKFQGFTWQMVINLSQIGTCSLTRVIEHWRHAIASAPELKDWTLATRQ
jgi:hypothetical protein